MNQPNSKFLIKLSLIVIGFLIFFLFSIYIFNYVVFIIPINSFEVYEDYTHLEKISLDQKNSNTIIKQIIPHNDVITVIFKGDVKTGTRTIPAFEYTDTYFLNQTILVGCFEKQDETYLSYYKIINSSQRDIEVLHKDGHTAHSLPCAYPSILSYTKNLE